MKSFSVISITIFSIFILGVFVFYHFAQSENILDLEIPQYGDELPETSSEDGDKTEKVKVVPHVKTPSAVRAVYMTSCVAGTPSLRNNLVKMIEETELNSVVIDIKDYAGTVSFTLSDPELNSLVSRNCFVSDMKEFIEELHQKDIYVIGRITVFQDSNLANKKTHLAVKRASDGGIWKDRKGISFVDAGAREAWDYNIAIGKEAYAIGFDELNFDYIRFPSDGNMRDIYFPFSEGRNKSVVLEEFFKYLSEQFADSGAVLSADIFGMTTTNFDDLNIGQVLEKALPYFDYVAPMVYPSHYPPNFNGWSNPNTVPYELIKFVMDSAVKRTVATSSPIDTLDSVAVSTTTPIMYTKEAYDKNKIRPWLQDFDYPVTYTHDMVKAQIQATYDAGLNSWMMWDPSNKYTPSVFLPAE